LVELGVIVGTSTVIGNVAGHSDFLGMEMQITLQAGGNAEKIVSKMYL